MNILNKILIIFLYLFTFSIPLFSESFKLAFKGIPIGDMLLGLIIIIYLMSILIYKDTRNRFLTGIREFFKDSLCIFMFMLYIVMSISVFYSMEKGLAISETERFATYLALFFIIKYEIYSEEVKENILNIYLWICGVLSIMGIVQYVTNAGLAQRFIRGHTFEANSRITVTLNNPNNYGAFLILAIFPVIMLTIKEKERKRKIYYSVLSLFLLMNIIFTFSRNAYLGFLMGCLTLVIVYSWRFIFIFGGVGAVSLFIPQIRVRFMQILDPVQNESRIKLWKTAIHMIKDHPILGVGNGNFVAYYNSYIKKYPELKYEDWKRYPSHNSYLKIESELGIFGIISFLGMILTAWFKVRQMIQACNNNFVQTFYTGFLASVAAFYFMNFFDNMFFVPRTTVYFYILLGISQSFLYNKDLK